jgi:hypothetical protein
VSPWPSRAGLEGLGLEAATVAKAKQLVVAVPGEASASLHRLRARLLQGGGLSSAAAAAAAAYLDEIQVGTWTGLERMGRPAAAAVASHSLHGSLCLETAAFSCSGDGQAGLSPLGRGRPERHRPAAGRVDRQTRLAVA